MLHTQFKLIIIFSIFFLLTSCSYLLPHRIDIQQGNIIEQKNVNKLQMGMRKDQVQFVLGTPMLIDMFHLNRWDYIYTIKTGHNDAEKTRITLYFEDDELVNIDGDMKPGVIIEEQERQSIITIPLEDYVAKDSSSWFSWLMWWRDDKETEKMAVNEPEPNAVNYSTKVPEIIESSKRN